jgi:hypothetical protein
MGTPASLAALTLAAASLVALPAAAALDMSEGLWETTITAESQSRSLGPSCYTKADIAEMERVLQGKSANTGGVCRYVDFVQNGPSVRYTMICRNGDDEQRSIIFAEYRGTVATGTIQTEGVTVTTVSRRVGSCTASSFGR